MELQIPSNQNPFTFLLYYCHCCLIDPPPTLPRPRHQRNQAEGNSNCSYRCLLPWTAATAPSRTPAGACRSSPTPGARPDFRSLSYGGGGASSYQYQYQYGARAGPVSTVVVEEEEVKRSKSKRRWLALGDPDMERKRRVAAYKAYAVEGKVKGSFRKSFRWIKDRYLHIVYGWS
ncbi:hypothetical protein ACQ4PT_012838 [Festuca glaucescens]